MFGPFHRKLRTALALAAAAHFGFAPAGAWAKPRTQAARQTVGPAPAYDGIWTIDATTSSFFCPVKSKRIWAVVKGGRVTKLSGLPAAASGEIGPDGAVALLLKLLGYTASVRGRMAGGNGAGDWSSNSFLCARGDWRAFTGH